MAQTSYATAGGIPWTLLIVGIIIVGGIWWDVNLDARAARLTRDRMTYQAGVSLEAEPSVVRRRHAAAPFARAG